MTLAHFYIWISVPFVLTTLFFGFYKGENVYYDSDDYDDSDDENDNDYGNNRYQKKSNKKYTKKVSRIKQ